MGLSVLATVLMALGYLIVDPDPTSGPDEALGTLIVVVVLAFGLAGAFGGLVVLLANFPYPADLPRATLIRAGIAVTLPIVSLVVLWIALR